MEQKPMKLICPRCRGNGYIKVLPDVSSKEPIATDCPQCDNQGEIKIKQKEKND